MFVREPQIGLNEAFSGTSAAILGQDLSVYASIAWTELEPFFDVQEATLISSVRFGVHTYSTEAGELLVGVKREGYGAGGGSYVYLAGAGSIAAGSASARAMVELDLDLILQVGCTLVVAHSAQLSGGGSYASADIIAEGGIVR
jgi:hypothetical protein